MTYIVDTLLPNSRCVVDAVIFALRDNGFLVYVPQYGLKGPVYLESRDKEVRKISYDPDFVFDVFYEMLAVFRKSPRLRMGPVVTISYDFGPCWSNAKKSPRISA